MESKDRAVLGILYDKESRNLTGEGDSAKISAESKG